MHTRTFPRTPVWAMALPWLLAAGPGWADENGPLQTQRCNDPPPAFTGSLLPEGDIEPLVTGKWLRPGTTRTTAGTNADESPELRGVKLYSATFQFSVPGQAEAPASGRYTEMITQGADKSCKCHLKIQVAQGCISRLNIYKYVHPLKLVADYRDDLSGRIPSKTATRSTDGTVISFDLRTPVCAGQDTRWLLLNTSVPEVMQQNVLELVTPEGQRTPLLPYHVPLN
ncbi:MAG TPA: hypothetical protein VFY73_24950 [Ideonella sp.]|uniref:hypothetical protein n=1 Tax=Ideonella sp. TaxID=1929293 RepID=UPI002E2FA26F|nr:hypothetical protein [Ideonella sp.]HEX5687278.1 hypothetical protein [Ideonella sp.]